MRDITKLIAFIVEEIIPTWSDAPKDLSTQLKQLSKQAYYTPPEMQQSYWHLLSNTLDRILGDPNDCPIRNRISRIVMGKEKLPHKYQ